MDNLCLNIGLSTTRLDNLAQSTSVPSMTSMMKKNGNIKKRTGTTKMTYINDIMALRTSASSRKMSSTKLATSKLASRLRMDHHEAHQFEEEWFPEHLQHRCREQENASNNHIDKSEVAIHVAINNSHQDVGDHQVQHLEVQYHDLQATAASRSTGDTSKPRTS